MYSNYNGGNRNGGYKSSYRSASYKNFSKKKKVNKRRLRNRIIIVASGILALVLVIVMISSFFSCVCSGCGGKGDTVETSTVAPTKAKPKKPKPASDVDPMVFNVPEVKEDEDAKAGAMNSGLYVYEGAAYELFHGDETAAKSYANAINGLSKKLGSGIKVYSMVVPNHTEMGLPAKYKNVENGAATSSQADYIKAVHTYFNKGVTPINCYNKLSAKSNEYIYFNGDHHWTGLGAYYAYTAFTDITKQKAVDLKDCEKKEVAGFTGSFFTMLGNDAGLKSDTVQYWNFPYDVPVSITYSDGTVGDYSSCYYGAGTSGSNTYGIFLWGDQPQEVIKSQSPAAKNKKIAIVHESYGNAIVPYFTYNYKEVHSIDFRRWNGDLLKYCKSNEIDQVLFVNGVMSSATAFQVDSIKKLIK